MRHVHSCLYRTNGVFRISSILPLQSLPPLTPFLPFLFLYPFHYFSFLSPEVWGRTPSGREYVGITPNLMFLNFICDLVHLATNPWLVSFQFCEYCFVSAERGRHGIPPTRKYAIAQNALITPLDYLDHLSEPGCHVDVKRRVVVRVAKWHGAAPTRRQVCHFASVELERIYAELSAELPQTLTEPRHRCRAGHIQHHSPSSSPAALCSCCKVKLKCCTTVVQTFFVVHVNTSARKISVSTATKSGANLANIIFSRISRCSKTDSDNV